MKALMGYWDLIQYFLLNKSGFDIFISTDYYYF